MFTMMGLRRRRGGQDQGCEEAEDQNDALGHNLSKTLSHYFVEVR
jgi:hypothetical protein